MKKLLLVMMVSLFTIHQMMAQDDFGASIAQARSQYKSGQLEEARFTLQQSLAAVDKEIGKEVLGLLPTSLSGLSYVADQDNVSGGSDSFAGLFVHRYYGDSIKSIDIELLSNSALLAGVNAILALPGFMTNNTENGQKVVKVNGYKALLQTEESEGQASHSLQIPFNQSLFQLDFQGSFSEKDVLAVAEQLPIDEMSKLTY